jgi:hypothetical protein
LAVIAPFVVTSAPSADEELLESVLELALTATSVASMLDDELEM